MDSAPQDRPSVVEHNNRVHQAEFQALINKTVARSKSPTKPADCAIRRVPTGFKVLFVRRIDNPHLWSSYSNQKASIRSSRSLKEPEHINFETTTEYLPPEHLPKLDRDVNEGYLFKAASKQDMEEIKWNGFTLGTQNCCSFTESMTRADQDIDPLEDFLYVFVARVCMGKAQMTGEPGCSRQHYDSILGNNENQNTDAPCSRDFMVFNKYQAYPEYLLKLEREFFDTNRNPSKWNEDETFAWAGKIIPVDYARRLKAEEVTVASIQILGVAGLVRCGVPLEHAEILYCTTSNLCTQFSTPQHHGMASSACSDPQIFCYSTPEESSPFSTLTTFFGNLAFRAKCIVKSVNPRDSDG